MSRRPGAPWRPPHREATHGPWRPTPSEATPAAEALLTARQRGAEVIAAMAREQLAAMAREAGGRIVVALGGGIDLEILDEPAGGAS